MVKYNILTFHKSCTRFDNFEGEMSLLELYNDNQFSEPLRYMCDCGFEGELEDWNGGNNE